MTKNHGSAQSAADALRERADLAEDPGAARDALREQVAADADFAEFLGTGPARELFGVGG